LAVQLTTHATDELQRARAIFRWITQNITYDTDRAEAVSRHSISAVQLSPEEIYRRRSGVCEDYAILFAAMAAAVGVRSEVVSGWGKTLADGLRSDLPAEPDHAWNAVRILGKWYLLDCTWAAGSADERGVYQRRFDGFFFLTPPWQFVYTHLPEDPRWQLLRVCPSRSGKLIG